jgi:tetratricopeptide (TPR) repeat protein
VLEADNQFEAATLEYQRAIDWLESSEKNIRQELSMASTSLASLKSRIGARRKAFDHFRRILSVDEKNLGLHHPFVGFDLANLGTSAIDLGRLSEASMNLHRSLSVLEETLPEEHRTLRDIQCYLATVESELQHIDEALSLSDRSVRGLSDEAPTVGKANLLSCRARVLAAARRYDEAERGFQASLAILRSLAPESTDLVLALCHWGSLRFTQGRYREASDVHRSALAMAERTAGPDDSYLSLPLSLLAEDLLALEQVTEAVSLLRRAEKMESPDDDQNQLASIHFALARALWELNEDRLAQKLARRSLEEWDQGLVGKRAPVQEWLAVHSSRADADR